MKNKNNKKEFNQARKNKCLLTCALTALACAVIAMFSAPIFIGAIFTLSIVLFVVTFKKKSTEQLEAEKKLEELRAMEELLKENEEN